MRLPAISGIIDRRILANYRIDPEVMAKALPSPFRPQLVNGWAIGGICLIRLTKDLLPDLNINDVVEGMGNRPSSPDNLPCIGEISALPGLLTAFGHSHWGMSMAPQTGRIIADLTVGKTPNIDISPYRADRFL